MRSNEDQFTVPHRCVQHVLLAANGSRHGASALLAMTHKWRCGTNTHAPQHSSSTSDPNTASRASQSRDHEICHLEGEQAAGMLLQVVSGGQTATVSGAA